MSGRPISISIMSGRSLRARSMADAASYSTDAADSLAMLLSVQGYAASVEYDAASAIERARRERPDMMLIDIGLPDMDGYQLAERLRAQPETAHTVLVAITGYGQPKDRERVIAAGIGHHLVKPVDMTALVRILESGAGMIGAPSLKG